MSNVNNHRLWMTVAIAATLILVFLFFHALLPSGVVLFATDDNIGEIARVKSLLPDAFLGGWDDLHLLGIKEDMPLMVRHLARWLLPARCFTNWIHALYLAGASLFLMLYFRGQGLRVESGLLGMITACWLGSNFTLIYPGHLGKFGVLMYAAAFLWCGVQAARRRQILWSLLAGGALGQMFVEQPDVAFFFSCVLGPYVLFTAWKEQGWNWKIHARIFLPMLFMAAWFAVPTLWIGYQSSVRGVATMDSESAAEKWSFCTQWSWPPEECVDFIAPGYMGWRSGDVEGPYWGRMGRSAGWETTRQGFQNFKLENQYLGAIPVVLAVFASVAAMIGWRRRRSGSLAGALDPDDGTSREIVFWTVAAGVTLLLAFGKYFPLYYLFYQLPVVSSIRNPNKFLQIFQLAVAILAAYGFELTIKCCLKRVEAQKGQANPLSRAEPQRC